MSDLLCTLCPHRCHIPEGKTGFCRGRRNEGGKNVCANYGRITSVAIDPIEKKPLVAFYPGSRIVSVGSYGCNLACPFCQNAMISMANENSVPYTYVSPEDIGRIVCAHSESIGLAFTYNEPLISYEYICDCAKSLKPLGKKIVLVTNGMISKEVLQELMPYVDAMNIDLKGDDEFYRTELCGDSEWVKETIRYVYDKCHLEITTLVIPGKNDDPMWIEETAMFLSSLDPKIPYHLSRYFPQYRYSIPTTERETILRLSTIARKHLRNVYTGNM